MANQQPTKLGRYDIIDELGRGAMGVVYLAKDPLIGRLVAVKTFKAGSSFRDHELEEFKQRFIREAQSAGILSHPNIVTIHDISAGGEMHETFIAMEYIEGTTLKDVLKSGNPVTPQFIAATLGEVGAGVDYAHSKGVVHRDIKPANIIITPDHKAKIMDFGIARIDTSNLTQEGQLLGTPNYMSPEQILGREVDYRSDLYALGVVLYEMLTRRKPFQGPNLMAVSHRIVYEPFTPPEDYVGALPIGLNSVLERALAKQPENRFQSASAMADAFQIALDGGTTTLAATVPQSSGLEKTVSMEAPEKPPGTLPPASSNHPDVMDQEESALLDLLTESSPSPVASVSSLPETPAVAPNPTALDSASSSELPLTESTPVPAVSRKATPPPVARPMAPSDPSSASRSSLESMRPPAAVERPSATVQKVVEPEELADSGPLFTIDESVFDDPIPTAPVEQPSGKSKKSRAKKAKPPKEKKARPKIAIPRWVWAVTIGVILGIGTALGLSAWSLSIQPAPHRVKRETRVMVQNAPVLVAAKRFRDEGRPELALQLYGRALRLAPENESLKTLRNSMREQVKKAVQESTQEQVEHHIGQAQEGLRRRRYDEAIDSASRVLRMQPGQTEATEILRSASSRIERNLAKPQPTLARTSPPPPTAPASPKLGEPEDSIVTIDFYTEISEGTLTIYAGQSQILRETFSFVEKKGWFSKRKMPGAIGTSRTLPQGPYELLVYATPKGAKTLTERVQGTMVRGEAQTLEIRLSEGQGLKVRMIQSK